MKKGWEYKRIDEVCSIARGGSPRPIKDFITTDPNGLNWIKIGDTDMGGKYIYSTKEKIKPEGLKKSRWVEEDEFLLSNSMSFGRPYILKTNGCIHDGWLVLRDYQKHLNIDFFYYVLSSEYVQKQFRTKAQGSTVSNLNTDRVASVTIPVPPLAEQQSIVSYLDAAFAKIDAMKANAEKALGEAKALFQASLKDLLTPKKGWEYKTIKECCIELFAGGDVPKANMSKNKTKNFTVPIYTNGIENEGLYGYTNNARVCEPAVTISARGTIGAMFRRFTPFYPAIRLITAVPNSDLLSIDYLYYALKTLTVGNSGTSIPQITIPNIKNKILPVPPLTEQQAIVTTLDTLKSKVDRLQENYEKISAECDALKQAILRQVFE